MGSCCEKREDILLLYLQGIKGSGLCESSPLSYYGNPEQCLLISFLGSMERFGGIYLERLGCGSYFVLQYSLFFYFWSRRGLYLYSLSVRCDLLVFESLLERRARGGGDWGLPWGHGHWQQPSLGAAATIWTLVLVVATAKNLISCTG